jgi:hypothetical protein
VVRGEPLFSGGLGGGALGIPLFGIAGGYALSGRGPAWSRVALGVVALAPIPAWAFALTLFEPALAFTAPRGAWIALFLYSFIATLALACSIPHRPVVGARADLHQRARERCDTAA